MSRNDWTHIPTFDRFYRLPSGVFLNLPTPISGHLIFQVSKPIGTIWNLKFSRSQWQFSWAGAPECFPIKIRGIGPESFPDTYHSCGGVLYETAGTNYRDNNLANASEYGPAIPHLIYGARIAAFEPREYVGLSGNYLRFASLATLPCHILARY